jgi:leucyl/phenylalanyl-tRNA---protein transferase
MPSCKCTLRVRITALLPDERGSAERLTRRPTAANCCCSLAYPPAKTKDLAIDIDLLLRAYANGIFPMADARDDPNAYWVEPKRRAILPLDEFHVSQSLAKTIRQDRYRVTADTAFADIIRKCAEATQDRDATWINTDIENAFIDLHQRGMAHSVECWHGDTLVGGLYGLAMGRAFFGESMFSRATDASKVALAWLVARLRPGGFVLLDCQFMTDHLASLGAIEISQSAYLKRLEMALGRSDQVSTVASPSASAGSSASGAAAGAGAASALGFDGNWGALDGLLSLSAGGAANSSGVGSSPGKLILQALTQTS